MEKKKWVEEKLSVMNTDQKIGQLLVLGFTGPVVTPDIKELITKYHIGGLRVTQGFRNMNLFNDVKPGEEIDEMTLRSMVKPSGYNRDYSTSRPIYASPKEYAGVLNELRTLAMEHNDGIPLHFTIDQEGSGSDDLLTGQRLFPHPMGLALTGDEELTYKVAKAVARQARQLGINMIHSPTLDVNTNPKNPEIGTRSYGETQELVTRYALQTMKGFQEEQLLATGKHFPGRGESEADAHWGLPTVQVDKETMHEVHLAPYRALIEAGLPAIMIAHSLYPSLGVEDVPAGMSKSLLHGLLREELGFEGVITTDNMMMGGILKQYEMDEACVRMLEGGCDLILSRDESPMRIRIIEKIKEAVATGRLTQEDLDRKVRRILNMRYEMGLHENGGVVDVNKADEAMHSDFVNELAVEAANRSTLLLRDRDGLLPIQKDTKVLLIEQVFSTQEKSSNFYSHPGLLWEQMCKYSDHVYSVEIPNLPTEADKQRVLDRVAEADLIVSTNYYYHKVGKSITEFVRECVGDKPTVVLTNTPYEFGAAPEFGSVLVSFHPGSPECLDAAAKIMFGEMQPQATLRVKGEETEVSGVGR